MTTATENAVEAENWQEAWLNSASDPYLFATGVLNFKPWGVPNPEGARQLERWQDKFLRNFYLDPLGNPTDNPRQTVRSGHGTGKLQPKTEPVLTPTGWRKIGDLRIGDQVATVDGSFTTVTGIHPQGNQKIYRVVLDDGTWTLAGEEHNWFTTARSERKHGKPGQVRTTGEIARSLTFPNGPRDGLNHCLPRLSRPIQHGSRDLPLEPYCFGTYLGDGSYSGIITMNALDAGHFLDEIGSHLIDENIWIRRKAENSLCAEGRLGPAAKQAIRDMGLGEARSWEKFIPAEYFHAAPEQRWALLQGLMDTDGTPGKGNNGATFDTSSEALADGVSELVRSLGGVARRSGRQGRLNGEDKRWSYRVFLALPESYPPFRSPRKSALYKPQHGSKNKDRTLSRFIAAVEEAGEADCVCISVSHPSQLYVTRDHIVTHNTTIISILATWFPLTHYDSKTVVTAASQDQLRDNVWAELKKTAGYLPLALRDQLQIDEERMFVKSSPEMSFVVRRTSSKGRPESLAGIHAKHVLVLVDEASGIDDVVFETAQGSLSTPGACACLFGNPTRSSGFFFETHNSLRHRWRSTVVSSEEVPRANGHISDIIAAYGKNSSKFRVRVLGEFPTADDDTVIPLEWAESAIDRDVVTLDYLPVWGVDVARFGFDKSAIAKRQANRLLEPVQAYSNLDTMQLCGIIFREYHNTHEDMRPKDILIDVIGIGSGVVDRCKELGLPVRGVNVAESSSSSDLCLRLRDQLWWDARLWLERRDCSMPNDPALISELIVPTYDFHSSGRIVVESKKDLRKRVPSMGSPDRADAFCLTFAGSQYRKAPIRRGPLVSRNPWAA